MTKSISSSTSRYLTVAEFLKRVDPTIVAQLCSDDPDNPVTVSALTSDVNLAAAIIDAEGEVEAAALIGERYTAADLQALAAASTAATGKLRRLIADIAWVYLWERRPNKGVQAPPSLERTGVWLEQLAQGKRIFGFEETAAAGLPEIEQETPEDVDARNGATLIAKRFFGRRSNREPVT